jgi:hypothetical protein
MAYFFKFQKLCQPTSTVNDCDSSTSEPRLYIVEITKKKNAQATPPIEISSENDYTLEENIYSDSSDNPEDSSKKHYKVSLVLHMHVSGSSFVLHNHMYAYNILSK